MEEKENKSDIYSDSYVRHWLCMSLVKVILQILVILVLSCFYYDMFLCEW